MNKHFHSIKFGLGILIILCSCYFLTTTNAFAYIDPGTGSFVFQIIIASFLGILTLAKIYWSRLKAFFDGIFTKQSINDPKK